MRAATYRFGAFELDLGVRELRCDGQVRDVQDKALEVLAYLVEHRNRLVTKDELIAAVWPGTVVTDAVVTTAVRKARLALHPDAAGLIKTVHRHGYRFVGSVSADAGGEPQGGAGRSGRGRPGPGSRRPCIAVLPFSSLTADGDQGIFAEAVTADITTMLAKHRWLHVVARHVARGAREQEPDVRVLAERLGVDYVVEGTVRRAGSRLRVTAELADARTGTLLWGDKYDRELAEVFDVQDEITRVVVGRLEPEIGTAERQKVPRTARPDLEAWECFHLALAHFYRFTAADNAEARRLLQRSRELDPSFGEAHAWWAYATVLAMVYWDREPSAAVLDEALEATTQALALDDQNALFYALKARVQLARREYGSAIAENQIAIRLNPTLAVAYCSLGDSLAYEGRYDDAVGRFETALALSPHDPQRWAFLSYGALALLFKGDLETALEWLERALEIPNCQYWALAHKIVALAHLDRLDEAVRVADQLTAAKPDFSLDFARRKLFYLKRKEQLAFYLEGLRRAGLKSA